MKRYPLWYLLAPVLLLGLLPPQGNPLLLQGMAAVFYMHPGTGDDSNNGTTWALAWKTVATGASAARIAPTDTICIAKSPDPTSLGNATWTYNSTTVTLAAACTASMYNCESPMWAGANCTLTADNVTKKQGTSSAKLVTGAGVTAAQEVAWADLESTQDYSAYQQLSFWMQGSFGAVTTDGLFVIKFYSDVARTSEVNSFSVPALAQASSLQVMVIDNGSALSSTVRAFSIQVTGSFASKFVFFDNFVLSKAPSANDSLTLASLIGKNTAGEPWCAIGSITGDTINLDGQTNSSVNTAYGRYGGTGETVETYKRECYKTTVATSFGTTIGTINDSGTSGAGNRIRYCGGWDTSTNVQDGITFWDGSNGSGNALYASSKSYIELDRLGFARYNYGFQMSGTCNEYRITNMFSAGCNTRAVYLYGTGHTITGWLGHGGSGFDSYLLSNAAIDGMVWYGASSGFQFNSSTTITFTNCKAMAGYFSGFSNGSTSCERILVEDCTFSDFNQATYGTPLYLGGSAAFGADCVFRSCTFSGGQSGSIMISTPTGQVRLQNCTVSDATEVVYPTNVTFGGYMMTVGGPWLWSMNHDNASGTHRGWTPGATVTNATDQRHTASGYAWKVSVTNTARNATRPARLPIARVAVANGAAQTITAWFYRDDADLQAHLTVPGGQVAGLDSDTSSSDLSSTSSWEQLSVQVTPSADGAVEVFAMVWTTNSDVTHSVWIDDLDYGTARDLKTLDYQFQGAPFSANQSGTGGAATTRSWSSGF